MYIYCSNRVCCYHHCPPNAVLQGVTSCYQLPSHFAVLGEIRGRDEKWTKEVNVVAWNGGKPKIDVRDWNEKHDRMTQM